MTKPWIQTYTGIAFWLDAPRAVDVDIRDIAHALSNLCRFTGHARPFYSVAEHSVWVSRLVPPEHALTALLHDAAEAYVGDVASPLKALMPEYRAIEAQVWDAVRLRFGLPAELPDCVKQADLHMLDVERRKLLGDEPASWELPAATPFAYFAGPFHFYEPHRTKRLFLERYAEIRLPELVDDRRHRVQAAEVAGR